MKKSTDLLQGNGEIDWITANGQHIPVGEKESKEEAVKKFVKSHENKANNAQKEKGEEIDEREQSSENLPKLDKNKPPPDEEAEDLKKEKVQQLIQKLNEVKKFKLKELVQFIQDCEPIELKIYDKTILAEFDKYSADKNIYAKGRSTQKGFNFKISHIQELPEFMQGAEYTHSKHEIGKMTKQHKGVKEWHYFKKEIQIGDEKYDVVINVRDKGNRQFVYEVIFR